MPVKGCMPMEYLLNLRCLYLCDLCIYSKQYFQVRHSVSFRVPQARSSQMSIFRIWGLCTISQKLHKLLIGPRELRSHIIKKACCRSLVVMFCSRQVCAQSGDQGLATSARRTHRCSPRSKARKRPPGLQFPTGPVTVFL